MSGNQANQELNKISHDPENGPWMTRDRRGRARREEEVMGNPPVSGPAGEDGTLPILEVDISSLNHFPSLPLPAGAPLGQGGSLQGPSNQDGGAQAAEGGEPPLHQMSYFGFRQSTFFLSGFSFQFFAPIFLVILLRG